MREVKLILYRRRFVLYWVVVFALCQWFNLATMNQSDIYVPDFGTVTGTEIKNGHYYVYTKENGVVETEKAVFYEYKKGRAKAHRILVATFGVGLLIFLIWRRTERNRAGKCLSA